MKRELDKILSYTKAEDACLIWTRCLNSDGYPRAVFDSNANGKVHRVVWELHNNQSAKGQVVRHSCDNPRCINPAHLSIGTEADNMRDRDERQRHGAAKLTHDDVRMIRRVYARGDVTQKEIGKWYGINSRTVNSLLKGHSWKHVN